MEIIVALAHKQEQARKRKAEVLKEAPIPKRSHEVQGRYGWRKARTWRTLWQGARGYEQSLIQWVRKKKFSRRREN